MRKVPAKKPARKVVRKAAPWSGKSTSVPAATHTRRRTDMHLTVQGASITPEELMQNFPHLSERRPPFLSEVASRLPAGEYRVVEPEHGTTGNLIDADGVNHPKHYNAHPTGVEANRIMEHFTANLGQATKYIWRCGLKDSEKPVKDLQKAIWYIQAEIDRLERVRQVI